MQRRRKVTGNCKEEGGGGALKTKVFRENSYAKQEFLVGWEKGFHTKKKKKKTFPGEGMESFWLHFIDTFKNTVLMPPDGYLSHWREVL